MHACIYFADRGHPLGTREPGRRGRPAAAREMAADIVENLQAVREAFESVTDELATKPG